MRVLLLLRGSPGCGKTTWIQNNNLSQYALSADDIRMMYSGPTMTVDGGFEINQKKDKYVWDTLFAILENRMQSGEFTVIDATNSKTSEMNRYKELCQNYRYRMFCVDFTDIPIEVAKERNLMRPPLKQVPEEVIDKMYSRFETQKIPSGITVIKPDELFKVWFKEIDLSAYPKIHVIGDVHGCYSALMEYFESNGGIHEDEYYIFVGDYIDRGLENADVVKFMLERYLDKNFLFIEGNHERWLWKWANNEVCQSKEFELFTRSQIEQADIDKKEVRKLYRKFCQCAYFSYNGNVFMVTHGGISSLPENLTLIPTEQMIKGVGGYNDCADVENAWVENTEEHFYQIHGHRNTKGLDTKANARCFNLEGRVEFGHYLRAVQLTPDGAILPVEIKNNVFKKDHGVVLGGDDSRTSVADVIISLRLNDNIQEKQFGNISSFNFTKRAFYDKLWDSQTVKARGLYINIKEQKVVARAYQKFWNINERPETEFEHLQNTLAFPVRAYVKENGFLGIVSYNNETDDLFITTKSNPEGPFAEWLRAAVYDRISGDKLEELKQYLKEHDVSFVFECVDMINDPHIIEYPENKLFLLDVVYNKIDFEKYNFEEMCEVSDVFGFEHKELGYVIDTWQEFFDWYHEVLDEDYLYNGRYIEGFVIEDAHGYMVKLKLSYYRFWKYMRSVSHKAIRTGYVDKRDLASFTTPLANQYYGWVRSLHDPANKDKPTPDICTLRKMFYESDVGKRFSV